MMINCPTAVAALTANGDATGYITVADASPFYPTARVWLRGNTTPSKEYIITDIVGNKIGLREVPETDNIARGTGGQSYGRSPVTQWTTADGAKIFQDAQPVKVEFSNFVKMTP
jgi:hypothetical protein